VDTPALFTGNRETILCTSSPAVWLDRKGLTWIAVSAILYALVQIPFNQLHGDIAGIPVRPAAALPVIFGILWGPAAAWGLGLGNLAGDYFGSWSPMSMAGFLVNFLYPYLSYLLWHRLVKCHEIRVDRYCLASFLAVTFVTTLACMAILAACGTVFFSRPFGSKFIGYFGNNIVWAMAAGPVLFWLFLEKAVQHRIVYGREWNYKIPPTVT
jgi:energy-coupling factor transport system substrate-specific component